MDLLPRRPSRSASAFPPPQPRESRRGSMRPDRGRPRRRAPRRLPGERRRPIAIATRAGERRPLVGRPRVGLWPMTRGLSQRRLHAYLATAFICSNIARGPSRFVTLGGRLAMVPGSVDVETQRSQTCCTSFAKGPTFPSSLVVTRKRHVGGDVAVLRSSPASTISGTVRDRTARAARTSSPTVYLRALAQPTCVAVRLLRVERGKTFAGS
jgi:hypothetical protein